MWRRRCLFIKCFIAVSWEGVAEHMIVMYVRVKGDDMRARRITNRYDVHTCNDADVTKLLDTYVWDSENDVT